MMFGIWCHWTFERLTNDQQHKIVLLFIIFRWQGERDRQQEYNCRLMKVCHWYTGSGHVEPSTYPVPEVIKSSITARSTADLNCKYRRKLTRDQRRHRIALRTTACRLPLGKKNGKALRRKNSFCFVYPSFSLVSCPDPFRKNREGVW